MQKQKQNRTKKSSEQIRNSVIQKVITEEYNKQNKLHELYEVWKGIKK